MKVAVSVVLAIAALARAADMAPQQEAAPQAASAPQAADGGAGPIPDSVKRLAKDLARVGGCFVQRFWNDAQRIDCGKCGPGAAGRNNLVSCVCSNQEQVARQIRRDFGVCVDRKAPFSKIITEVGADVGGLGLSALCGAYAGGSHHHHHPTHRPGRPLPEPVHPGARPSRPDHRGPGHHHDDQPEGGEPQPSGPAYAGPVPDPGSPAPGPN